MLKRLLAASLFLVLCFAGWSSDLADFRRQVSEADEISEIISLSLKAPKEVDEYGLDWVSENKNRPIVEVKRELIAIIDAAILNQQAAATKGQIQDPNAEAAKIIKDPKYSDQGAMGDKNWLSASFEKLGQAISDMISSWFKDNRRSGGNAAALPSIGGLSFLVPIMQGLLILLLLGGLIWMILAIRKSPRFKKKSTGGLLEDDEPDRTADEWLVEAARLEGQGQIREACRCLYIACLVRLDEAGVARFDRGQTNWEHQRRIEFSPKMISGLTFLEATKRFDLVWYGRTFSQADLDFFRSQYKDIVEKSSMRSIA